MITPRTTRLLRVPDLQAMHRALAECIRADASAPAAVIVPTAGAAEALGRTLAIIARQRGWPEAATPAFELLTRDDFYLRLHERFQSARPMLTAFEREVLLTRAASAASDSGTPAPFRLRPGLIVEILAFYDELRRRDRTVADFDRLMTDSLQASVEIDRGAERLFRQTQFLTAAFTRFEDLVASSGRLDEHALRRLLLAHDGRASYPRVVVSVADQPADPRGLWTADFDFLARLPGLTVLDIVATENVLAAGFHERVHDVLPGIEEERREGAGLPPVLVTPPHSGDDTPTRWFVSRDREEELVALVRATPGEADRVAVVFQRPLPYLYLARSVFADAGRPYQALDSLPLAGEPFAGALDVVFAFVVAAANRASTIDLLSSPHWQFPELDGLARVGQGARERARCAAARAEVLRRMGPSRRARRACRVCDRRRRPAGQLQARARRRPRADAGQALRAAVAAAEALRPLREAATASGQLHALLDFIRTHERAPAEGDAWAARHERARAAVVGALESLADAHARHDDAPLRGRSAGRRRAAVD